MFAERPEKPRIIGPWSSGREVTSSDGSPCPNERVGAPSTVEVASDVSVEDPADISVAAVVARVDDPVIVELTDPEFVRDVSDDPSDMDTSELVIWVPDGETGVVAVG